MPTMRKRNLCLARCRQGFEARLKELHLVLELGINWAIVEFKDFTVAWEFDGTARAGAMGEDAKVWRLRENFPLERI